MVLRALDIGSSLPGIPARKEDIMERTYESAAALVMPPPATSNRSRPRLSGRTATIALLRGQQRRRLVPRVEELHHGGAGLDVGRVPDQLEALARTRERDLQDLADRG
jgi:hypothetical protein